MPKELEKNLKIFKKSSQNHHFEPENRQNRVSTW